jgi:putative molybdopterin biosynthesis protein
LAEVLDSTVEDLFGRSGEVPQPAWAWAPACLPSRYWRAEVNNLLRAYPVELTPCGEVPHDGVAHALDDFPADSSDPRRTLVIAGCDPAAALLSGAFERSGSYRMLSLQRSSRRALDLLASGLVHVAGIHLSSASASGGNADVVAEQLGTGYRLLRLAHWEEGIAFHWGQEYRTVKALLRSPVRWVGREKGSGARQCLDELFGRVRRFRHTASDHRSVASAIQGGWADAGVCPRLVGDEAGLRFHSVRWAAYDLCYSTALEDDPRVRTLLQVVRDIRFRRLLGELPGYDTQTMGDLSGT